MEIGYVCLVDLLENKGMLLYSLESPHRAKINEYTQYKLLDGIRKYP